jgi:23S rRNA pseudouridine2605 synthase
MPRDNDKDNRRPPGRRGPPSRGGGGGGRDKRPGGGGFRKEGGSFKPREGRAGGSFGKARDGAPRSEGGRADRAASKRFGDKPGGGKRFGDKRGSGKSFGEKRSFGKSEGGFRKDGDRPPRREFNRDDRPKRDFAPRAERGGEQRPRSDAPRTSFRKDADRPPRRDFKSDGERPPRRDFKRDDARGDFKRGEGRPENRGPRRDFKDRNAGGGDGRDGERARPRDGDKRFERPRGDRPFGGKPRDARPGADRPRFSRDRNERPSDERPRPARPRGAMGRTSHAWRDHPRSEEAPETRERSYEPRPAFGGRGEYRERKPDRDFRKREVEPAPGKAKKAGDRIAKLMARAGLCSRRDAEEWIRQGRVSVNGRIISSPALDVTSHDAVLVDGAPLPERERTRLFLYHKPKGLVTTHADPEGRPTVFDSLPEGLPRLISIGRLDFNTEGLLLLTNDGGLARVLELPDTGWMRRYRVRAHGEITQDRLDELRKGVEVDGVKYGPIEATLERDQGANVWVLFAIREGKNREVRNVMTHLGLEVNRLIRVSYGPFQLGELAEGQVEEVRSRLLRDQLGERITAAAGADFKLPVQESDSEERADDAAEKPRRRTGLIADRKGRPVLVERSARDGNDDERPPRKPPSGYKGKRGRSKDE